VGVGVEPLSTAARLPVSKPAMNPRARLGLSRFGRIRLQRDGAVRVVRIAVFSRKFGDLCVTAAAPAEPDPADPKGDNVNHDR